MDSYAADALLAKLPGRQQLAALDLLIQRLEDVKQRVERGGALPGLTNALKTTQTKVNDSQKEFYNAVNKLSKGVDKKFTADLKPLLPKVPTDATNPFAYMYFADENSQRILDEVIADHLVREGQIEAAKVLSEEANIEFPQETLSKFQIMHLISASIEKGDLEPALLWTKAYETPLEKLRSPLPFHLHRSRFVSLLTMDEIILPTPYPGLVSTPDWAKIGLDGKRTGPSSAVAYARAHFMPFFARHSNEIQRLISATAYMPLERLSKTSYKDVFHPFGKRGDDFYDPSEVHAAYLVPLFTRTYCAVHGLPAESPLKVVTDVGGGGALARIAKVRSVMEQTKTEWSQKEELPTEIAVPLDYRFHSVFACPVSKEQTSEDDRNPPFMMPCGHVISKDSLNRLAKGGQDVKCPYCPAKSALSSALRVYF